MCTSKCLPHRHFWIDLSRIDECECKATSKRFYSNHNYIFDIPLDKLFELSNNINLIEMSKSFKLKSGKFSEVGSTEMSTISDLKGKLFLYFKMLLNSIKVDCPAKGIRCEVNKTNKNFYLNNFPTYLNFNLQRIGVGSPCHAAQVLSIFEILKTFVLIPKIFDLGTLFDHSSKQKVFFEFFGAILLKPGKNYSCFFKNNTSNTTNSHINDYLYIHYDDDKITNFSSQFDLISFCLKNCEVPVLLFYQIQEKYNDSEKDISLDELQILERYARNADNLNNIISNRFRSNEDIIRFEKIDSTHSQSHSQGVYTRNPSNASTLPLNQSSKNSSSISTSKPSSTNNSNSRIDPVTEYACINCYSKNRIECPVCLKCNKNNEAAIEDLLKKRNNMNYINIANFNLNINTGVEVPRERDNAAMGINNATSSNSVITTNAISNSNVNPHTIPGRTNVREENTRDSKNSSLKKGSGTGVSSLASNPFAPASIATIDKKSLNTIGTSKYNDEESDEYDDDYRKGNVVNKDKGNQPKSKYFYFDVILFLLI
jgi:hypothetical protein